MSIFGSTLGSTGGGGGGAVTVADGADVAEGATTDSKVTGDNTGTLSAKLRGINTILADVWDSVSHFLKVSIQNTTLAVTQSGTWTVQPGNTANTTAWKVDGSAVTQPISGTITTTFPSASAETLSNVASSASNVTILASNASRKGAIFFNDSTQACYVKFGATASTSSYTYKIFPSQTLELPVPIYTGIIDGIWDSANGNMRITETT